MEWYKRVKTADVGHGDTLDGKRMKNELVRLTNVIDRLRKEALDGGPIGVLPRWRGEVRRHILLLPATDRLDRLSMMELDALDKRVEGIKASMSRYDAARLKEITGG